MRTKTYASLLELYRPGAIQAEAIDSRTDRHEPPHGERPAPLPQLTLVPDAPSTRR
jgi:hypothetical protein